MRRSGNRLADLRMYTKSFLEGGDRPFNVPRRGQWPVRLNFVQLAASEVLASSYWLDRHTHQPMGHVSPNNTTTGVFSSTHQSKFVFLCLRCPR